MVKIKSQEAINWILGIFLVIIGLVLAYQLLKKIFGGSWELETVILTLVIANLGYSFYIGNKLSGELLRFSTNKRAKIHQTWLLPTQYIKNRKS